MMRKIINVGYANIHRRVVALLSAITCLLSLLLLAPSALADYYYLKPGQSKTISTPAGLDTVFISNPNSADYKIVGESKMVIYGRETGYSDITLYDNKANVLKKITIEVDPILADTLTRVKTIFPDSKVRVSKVTGTDSGTGKGGIYILSGTVPNEDARDTIYQIIGEAVGGSAKELTVNDSVNVAGGIKADEIEFMTKYIYRNIINRLTLPQTNQVNVRLTVVEVNKDFKDNLGIDWSNVGVSGTFGLIGFRGLDRRDIHNTITALQNDDLARVLAQPNLTVLSGEVASFLVGGEVPITVRDTTNNSVSVEYKEYGVKLSIAAKVESTNKIKLFLSNELSSVDGTTAKDVYSVPMFKTRKTSSTIELADGDSFAVAGLLNESDIESLSKVPFVGDIPIIGALARSTSLSRQKSELMVFATVNLVKPTSSSANIELPSFKKTSMSKLFFNVGVDKAARENRLNNNNSQLTHDSEVFLNRGGFAK